MRRKGKEGKDSRQGKAIPGTARETIKGKYPDISDTIHARARAHYIRPYHCEFCESLKGTHLEFLESIKEKHSEFSKALKGANIYSFYSP